MQRLYQATVARGVIKANARQEAVVAALGSLQRRLAKYEPQLDEFRAKQAAFLPAPHQGQPQEGGKGPVPVEPPTPPRKPRGLYLHGHVGTGKTMLMDMFFETTQVERKRRVHLHDFMNEVHERIHRWKHTERVRLAEEEKREEELQLDKASKAQRRAAGPAGQDEPQDPQRAGEHHVGPAAALPIRPRFDAAGTRLPPRVSESDGIAQVGRQLAQENSLLAFDEFVVTDVVDALILKHLFGVMFEEGTVMVATSNTAPGDLYRDGLNYYYFAPFIGLLTAHCKVLDMDMATDFRLELGTAVGARYLWPATRENQLRFEETFNKLCSSSSVVQCELKVAFGRTLVVPACAADMSVCRFSFDYLCGDREPVLSAADYKSLCDTFDTIMIEGVPRLGLGNHNETRRFITLVDQLYDRGVQVVLLADVGPLELYDGGSQLTESDQEKDGELFSLKEMRTASRRMASRLVEMTRGALGP